MTYLLLSILFNTVRGLSPNDSAVQRWQNNNKKTFTVIFETQLSVSSHIGALHLDGLSINGIFPSGSRTRTEPKGTLMEKRKLFAIISKNP